MNFYEQLSSLRTCPGAETSAIQDAQDRLGGELPKEYTAFLRETNGAEGVLGSEYIVLWPVERLVEENEIAAEFITGFILFGSDGGGEAYAFDCRSAETRRVVQVPFATYDAADVEVLGDSFRLWLDGLSG